MIDFAAISPLRLSIFEIEKSEQLLIALENIPGVTIEVSNSPKIKSIF